MADLAELGSGSFFVSRDFVLSSNVETKKVPELLGFL
jgi:hypothetical protein